MVRLLRTMVSATAAMVVTAAVAMVTATTTAAAVTEADAARVPELERLDTAQGSHYSGYLRISLDGEPDAHYAGGSGGGDGGGGGGGDGGDGARGNAASKGNGGAMTGPATEADVFYYFVEHPDPSAPLLVWMNGGPGSSSMVGLFAELGPLLINGRSEPPPQQGAPQGAKGDHGAAGNWTLFANPSSWSTVASLLVWEQPAGVGFSRCVAVNCPTFTDESSAAANLRVLLAFYGQFASHLVGRDLFISGESYAGIYVPMLAQLVHDHNQRALAAMTAGSRQAGLTATSAAVAPVLLPLKGVLVGNGCVGFGVDGGCGRDSLELLLTVLDRGAPGIDEGVTSAARATCGAELDDGIQNANQLSAACHQVR
jgi:hypothetical protein